MYEKEYSFYDNKNYPKMSYKRILSEKKPARIISSSEGRLMKYIEELKKKEIWKYCQVIVSDYKK